MHSACFPSFNLRILPIDWIVLAIDLPPTNRTSFERDLMLMPVERIADCPTSRHPVLSSTYFLTLSLSATGIEPSMNRGVLSMIFLSFWMSR